MSTFQPEPASQQHGAGKVSAAISNALVQLHRQQYGKGPTKAKTYLLDDLVVCVLEGGALRIEEALRDRGEEETVHHVRRTFQSAFNEDFRAIVERETGRRVRTFMSQFDSDDDIGVEIFFLSPQEG
jgi:uncharacterized protein YbcI